MRRSFLAAAAAVSFVGLAGTTNAAIVIGNVQPANVGLPRPAPTFDFDLNTPPVTNGVIKRARTPVALSRLVARAGTTRSDRAQIHPEL